MLGRRFLTNNDISYAKVPGRTQIDAVLTNCTWIQWSPEDLASCFPSDLDVDTTQAKILQGICLTSSLPNISKDLVYSFCAFHLLHFSSVVYSSEKLKDLSWEVQWVQSKNLVPQQGPSWTCSLLCSALLHWATLSQKNVSQGASFRVPDVRVKECNLICYKQLLSTGCLQML